MCNINHLEQELITIKYIVDRAGVNIDSYENSDELLNYHSKKLFTASQKLENLLKEISAHAEMPSM